MTKIKPWMLISMLLLAVAGAIITSAAVSAQSRPGDVKFESIDDQGNITEREIDGTQVAVKINGTVVATRPLDTGERDAFFKKQRANEVAAAEVSLVSAIATLQAVPSTDPVERAVIAIGQLLIEPEPDYPTPTPTSTPPPIETIGGLPVTLEAGK